MRLGRSQVKVRPRNKSGLDKQAGGRVSLGHVL